MPTFCRYCIAALIAVGKRVEFADTIIVIESKDKDIKVISKFKAFTFFLILEKNHFYNFIYRLY